MKNEMKKSAQAEVSASTTVRIEKPIYGGKFLAHAEGKAVFVPLVLPGEQARVRVAEAKRGYATAEVEEIVTPAPERIAPRCKHFGACGGCDYQHAGYAQQLEFKEQILRETFSRAGVEVPEKIEILAGEPWGYRNRIRLAFNAQGNLGYRGRGSHAIIPIEECPIAAPILVKAALAAQEALRAATPTWRPTEISFFTTGDESALAMSVYAQSGKTYIFEKFAEALRERVPQLSGAELLFEEKPVGRKPAPEPHFVACWGENALAYHAAEFDYRVEHGAFFQVNRLLVDQLVEQVTRDAQGTLAWDLYAGVGLFSRPLAARFERVVAVEIAPTATATLSANLEGTGGTAVKAATLDFLRQNKRVEKPDWIVVDPPRAGLGPDVTKVLGEIAAPAITYVSCDPATLARDLKALVESGYAIAAVTLADLFPQTLHLETVVQLRRA
jgi:23S rRNA (uracil1939-C5)-methyltransferase